MKNKNINAFIFIFLLFVILFTLQNNIYITFNSLKDKLFSFNDKNNNKDIIGTNLNKEKEEELKQLKETLNIKDTLSEYEKINAVVVERNLNYWMNNITINKGSNDGIEVGMCVVVSEGLIGRVVSVSKKTSVIKLITSSGNSNKISVKLLNNGKYIYKILEVENNSLVISGIDNNIELSDDIVITTSGLSDIYPSGLYIGTMEKYEIEKYGLGKKVYVSTNIDWDNIKFVTVLSRKIK